MASRVTTPSKDSGAKGRAIARLRQHLGRQIERHHRARRFGQGRTDDAGAAGDVENFSRAVAADCFAEAAGQLLVGDRSRSRKRIGLAGELALHALQMVHSMLPGATPPPPGWRAAPAESSAPRPWGTHSP